MFGRKKENDQQPAPQPAAPEPMQGASPAQPAAPTPAAQQAAPPQPAAAQQPAADQQPQPAAQPLTEEQKKIQAKKLMQAKMVAAAFGEIVSLFMRSPQHRHYQLADLEWLVGPPVLTGQFVLAEARNKDAVTAPVGVVLWAAVSEEVDARLAANPQEPIRLTREEWKSGDILWIVEAIGHEQALKGIINNLHQKVFRGKPVKVRGQDADGNPVVNIQKLG